MAFLIKSSALNGAIPAGSESGFSNSIKFLETGTVEGVEMSIHLTGNPATALSMQLEAPSGAFVNLDTNNGNGEGDYHYNGTDLSGLNEEKVKGNWTLRIASPDGDADVKLRGWSLRVQPSKDGASEIFIPDAAGKKLVSKQVCDVSGEIKDITARIDIEHSYVSDLEVVLNGPNGSVVLHDRQGGDSNDLVKTYGRDDLAAFIGTKAKGTWTLEVADHEPRDHGRIRSWHIDLRV